MGKLEIDLPEVIIIIVGSLWIIYAIFFASTPSTMTYVPNVITSFATLSGILTAFIGFWLTQTYLSTKKVAEKKWIRARIKVIAIIIAYGQILIWISITRLLYEEFEYALIFGYSGTGLTMLSLIEVIYILAFREIWR